MEWFPLGSFPGALQPPSLEKGKKGFCLWSVNNILSPSTPPRANPQPNGFILVPRITLQDSYPGKGVAKDEGLMMEWWGD